MEEYRYFILYECYSPDHTGNTIDVFYGCGLMTCECGKCKTPIGKIDKKKTMEFLENQITFEQFIEMNVIKN